jgi:ubiquinone/menaquinone biosynthesis C-methylase UbiE
MSKVVEQKEKQVAHMDEHFKNVTANSFQHGEYHDYFRELPFLKIRDMVTDAGLDLTGRSLLIAGCGSGIDIFYLKKHFDAEYFVTDISQNAVNAVLSIFPGIQGQVEDTEAMSFADNSFDYAFTAASLHHLPRPPVGLYELLRVARKGVIVIEPNDSLLCRIATRFGLATEVEESGNYVYRFSFRDVEKCARSLFVKFTAERLFATHRVASSRFEFLVLKLLNRLSNLLFPRQGNYIVFMIEKDHEQAVS